MFFDKFLPNTLLSLLVFNSFNALPSVLATEKNEYSFQHPDENFKSWCGKYLPDKKTNSQYDELEKELDEYYALIQRCNYINKEANINFFYKMLKCLYSISRNESENKCNIAIEAMKNLLQNFGNGHLPWYYKEDDGCISYGYASIYTDRYGRLFQGYLCINFVCGKDKLERFGLTFKSIKEIDSKSEKSKSIDSSFEELKRMVSEKKYLKSKNV